jgi:alkylhydroperoxidase family enzyme
MLKSWIRGSALVQGLQRVAPTDLFAGVEKPSITLAKLLASEMLQNLDVAVSSRDAARYESGYSEAKFPLFTIRVESPFLNYEGKPSGERKVTRVTLKTGESLTGADEFAILLTAYDTFLGLRKRKRSLTAEEKRQQAALDAIEQLFKPKVVEAPVVEPAPMSAIDTSFLKVE